MKYIYVNYSLTSYILVACFFASSFVSLPVYAQTSTLAMNKATSGGSLNVSLQTSPNPVRRGTPTNLKVIFDQKGSKAVQPHIDYDLTITKNSKQIFQASALAGHPNQPLHTAEGIVTIPYAFQQSGQYLVNVTVYGILFNPIKPEYAQFPISVS